MALTWIRLNSSVKGRPNMTAADLHTWVISAFLPQDHPQVPSSISERITIRWLHQLGFEPVFTKKGVYIDGHEHSDAVEYRKLYLRKLEILESTHVPPPPVSDEPAPEPSDCRKLVLIFHNEAAYHSNAHAPPPPVSDEPAPEPSDRRKLVLIFHNEAAYHSNDDQKWMWAEKGKQPIRPKGQGQSIMVSEFIEEHGGYLRLSDEEYKSAKDSPLTQTLLSFGLVILYPKESHSLVVLFDQSSDDDALNVNRMNVRPGGAQAILHDTVWNGRGQKMVFSDGTPKGMKHILEERGVNTKDMKM